MIEGIELSSYGKPSFGPVFIGSDTDGDIFIYDDVQEIIITFEGGKQLLEWLQELEVVKNGI